MCPETVPGITLELSFNDFDVSGIEWDGSASMFMEHDELAKAQRRSTKGICAEF